MIEIYSKENCAYCTWTKALLERKGLNYSEKKLGREFTREFILETFPNDRTFPIILVDGNNVGGYEGLQTYLNRSEPAHHNMSLLID